MNTAAARLLRGLQTTTVTLALLVFGLASAPASSGAVPETTGTGLHDVCSASHHGQMACTAILNRNIGAQPFTTTGLPAGFGPADLRSAYNVPSLTMAVPRTVAVVVAFDAPTLEADLGTYRAKYGLPACTSATGCFQKVNQTGAAAPLPAVNSGWAQEASLDVDMVSAACPACHILVVEANSDYLSDLGPSVNTAVSMGAVAVNNSYGGAEQSGISGYDSYYTHPGVTVTAAAGDNGYGVQYPAAVPAVTAVGGTSLSRTSSGRGWSESVWGAAGSNFGTGSGCSAYETKPAWQTDTGCATRTVTDISAVADPNTGLAIYDSTPDSYGTSGWLVMGGTSASAPFIAGLSALAGTPTNGTDPASYAYAVPTALNDVTTGSTGSCSPAYLCSGTTGYDGPTGMGTPNGLAAVTDLKTVFSTMQNATANAWLGASTGAVTCGGDGGCSQPFTGGHAYWSAATGAVPVDPQIEAVWKTYGGATGRYGYPVTGPSTDSSGTVSQQFQNGTLSTAAPQVSGSIAAEWNATGGASGPLGNPTSAEAALGTGGSYQQFDNGVIYQSSASGAHMLLNSSPILDKWKAAGADAGALGYPTADAVTGLVGGGSSQQFQGGEIVFSPATGAHIVKGGISTVWNKFGAQNGKMGYPTSDEIGGLANGGVYQTYQGGAIYWTPATGAHMSTGGIRSVWLKFGAQDGKMGYPTSDEIGGLANGGVYQTYQGGAIYWTPATGAHMSTGGIRTEWGRLGYEHGKMGYPTSDENSGLIDGGVYQTYQGGAIYWAPATGAHMSTGGIRTAWGRLGYENGRLGYPTSDEYAISGGVRQTYQGGYIDYSYQYGVQVHLQ
ncbi:hypothetical protein KIH31_00135 [Paenarthrobacter sp. DKR-5]|uniref:hypothetical protein n=1 Tax=Paenarthrobacter sp. DKR-5 TaxID=2835535 RepID=UPI001BDD3440|nr:hypothetical protein [Paenarthrobacter sp. DKR-5]MBT1000997.1 hypothetical protein [Paenarthrobacter sp. DKR-5]